MRHPGAHLLIAGPDSDGTLAQLQALVRQMDLRESVTFCWNARGRHEI